MDIENGGTRDMMKAFVWEPALNKQSAIAAATEAACTILAIDETIRNAKAQSNVGQQAAPNPGAMPGGRPSIR